MTEKIEACACGKSMQRVGVDYMEYHYRSCLCGWYIARPTAKERDAAWNEVMRAVRMMKRLREPVGTPKDEGIDLTQLPKGKPTAYSEGGPAR